MGESGGSGECVGADGELERRGNRRLLAGERRRSDEADEACEELGLGCKAVAAAMHEEMERKECDMWRHWRKNTSLPTYSNGEGQSEGEARRGRPVHLADGIELAIINNGDRWRLRTCQGGGERGEGGGGERE